MTTTSTVLTEMPSAGEAPRGRRRRGTKGGELRAHVDQDRLLPRARPRRRVARLPAMGMRTREPPARPARTPRAYRDRRAHLPRGRRRPVHRVGDRGTRHGLPPPHRVAVAVGDQPREQLDRRLRPRRSRRVPHGRRRSALGTTRPRATRSYSTSTPPPSGQPGFSTTARTSSPCPPSTPSPPTSATSPPTAGTCGDASTTTACWPTCAPNSPIAETRPPERTPR